MDIYNDLKHTLMQQYQVKNKMKINRIVESSNSTREIDEEKNGRVKDTSPCRSPAAETILLNKTGQSGFHDIHNKNKNSKIESGSLSNIDESSIQDLHRNASNILMSKIESFKLQEGINT